MPGKYLVISIAFLFRHGIFAIISVEEITQKMEPPHETAPEGKTSNANACAKAFTANCRSY